MSAVLDAGLFLAVERRDRAALATLRVLERDAVPLRTSAAVVAQVWRGGPRSAATARLLRGVDVVALDDGHARAVGELLGATQTADAVDGHVALLCRSGDVVLTSDPDDVRRLVTALGTAARVHLV